MKIQSENFYVIECSHCGKDEMKIEKRDNQKNNINYSYSIYGLDADLIFLALSTESNSIYLLREANERLRR